MPDIRYVCLSDMHLGEEDSLLTNLPLASTDPDPLNPSLVMLRLVECLRELISKNEDKKKPTLVLNGDILEMALTTTNQAAMVFERFVELIMPRDKELFDKIICIPGNHDHHIWELARETQYVKHITKESASNKKLDPPWHTTKMFMGKDPDIVPSYLLTNLVKRVADVEDFQIAVVYPNFGLITKDNKKCVIFHHGHFTESIYQLMSTFNHLMLTGQKMPNNVYDIEAENFAWIDFFWSMMGRSGQAGITIEALYEKMGDREELSAAISNFADNLNRKYDLPGPDMITTAALKAILRHIVSRVAGGERSDTTEVLSKKAKKGLREYIRGPVIQQIKKERTEDIPRDLTFVFGHTHKPFSRDMPFKKDLGIWIDVYNTGGWVVESVEREKRRGSAVVLLDENLNATSLRMYNEADNWDDYSVLVEEAKGDNQDRPNPFHQRIEGLVQKSPNPWKSFSRAAARDVHVRARLLEGRIEEEL